MTYKEIICFIAQCLTISLEEKNREVILSQLKHKKIDWERVVKVSTDHLVFPALYCNLMRARFLKYLPKELASYMKKITDLNRNRNKKIITQAKKLNKLLLSNNITPIYLKGTGNLLANLYQDIAERMVGDIDFIFSKEDYPKAIKILREDGYLDLEENKIYFPSKKHYRRIVKKENIAAIEIHRELVSEKHSNEFDFEFVEKDCQLIDQVNVLSYSNKLNLSIISNQINDHGFYYKTILLRNAYDIFLLSKKTSAKDAVNSLNKLSYPLNCFLAASYEIFNRVKSLEYNKSSKTIKYLSAFNYQFLNYERTKKKHYVIKQFLSIKSRLNIISKSIFDNEYRNWLFKRLINKK